MFARFCVIVVYANGKRPFKEVVLILEYEINPVTVNLYYKCIWEIDNQFDHLITISRL